MSLLSLNVCLLFYVRQYYCEWIYIIITLYVYSVCVYRTVVNCDGYVVWFLCVLFDFMASPSWTWHTLFCRISHHLSLSLSLSLSLFPFYYSHPLSPLTQLYHFSHSKLSSLSLSLSLSLSPSLSLPLSLSQLNILLLFLPFVPAGSQQTTVHRHHKWINQTKGTIPTHVHVYFNQHHHTVVFESRRLPFLRSYTLKDLSTSPSINNIITAYHHLGRGYLSDSWADAYCLFTRTSEISNWYTIIYTWDPTISKSTVHRVQYIPFKKFVNVRLSSREAWIFCGLCTNLISWVHL